MNCTVIFCECIVIYSFQFEWQLQYKESKQDKRTLIILNDLCRILRHIKFFQPRISPEIELKVALSIQCDYCRLMGVHFSNSLNCWWFSLVWTDLEGMCFNEAIHFQKESHLNTHQLTNFSHGNRSFLSLEMMLM